MPDRLNETVEPLDGKVVFKPVGRLIEGAAAAHFPASPNEAEQGDNDKGYVIAIVMGYMARGHEFLPQAGENLFIDSTFNVVNNIDSKLVMMMADTPLGGFPLAMAITNATSTAGYAAVFEAVKEALPGDKAFFGRGARQGSHSSFCATPLLSESVHAGCRIDTFTTDRPPSSGYPSPANVHADMGVEGKAAERVWPGIVRVICGFHTQQAINEHIKVDPTIPPEDKVAVAAAWRKLFYWDSPQRFGDALWDGFLGAVDSFLLDGADCTPRRTRKHWPC